MTRISQPIVFFGTEDFSLGALKALVEAKFTIAAVVTKPDSPKGRGHHLTPPVVKEYAIRHNIPVWQPKKLSEITEGLMALNQPVGVLVSFGKIIPQQTLNLFTPGIINVHPSLLPKYRGPSPIETAIINGDNKTGVSIMKLSAAMDAGPVYCQTEIPLDGTEMSPELYDKLSREGSALLLQSLPGIIDGSISPTPQIESDATYCDLIKKADGIVDWNERAEVIEAQIRAYRIWPQSRTSIGQVEVIITKAEVIPGGNHKAPGSITITADELIINTGQGLLRLLTIKPVGKKEMPIQAFLAGYRTQLGV